VLAADHRLRDSTAFRRTITSGRRVGSPALVVHLSAPSATSDVLPRAPRVGLVVNRAVGSAVTRNRVKRRLRHQVADLVGTLSPGSDLVVRALPPAAAMSSAELRADLARCLGRALRNADRVRTEA
jgi:ribonuclease P protein component